MLRSIVDDDEKNAVALYRVDPIDVDRYRHAWVETDIPWRVPKRRVSVFNSDTVILAVDQNLNRTESWDKTPALVSTES